MQQKTTSRLKACENCGHQKGKHTTGKQANCFYPKCTCRHYTYTKSGDNFLVLHSGKINWIDDKTVKQHEFVKVTAKNIGLTIQSLLHFSPNVKSISITLIDGSESR